jgi:hypothetical protein
MLGFPNMRQRPDGGQQVQRQRTPKKRNTLQRLRIWMAAFLAVLAAYILAWCAAPFPGWDLVFYMLLPGFLVTGYGWNREGTRDGLERPAPPQTEKQDWWMISLLYKEAPAPLWRDLLITTGLVALVGGIYWFATMARLDPPWFKSHIAGPLGLFILGWMMAVRDERRRWREEGHELPRGD